MQPVEVSGVSVVQEGKEWKAVCAVDRWEKSYPSLRGANHGATSHRQSKLHRENGNGTREPVRAGEVPQHSGPSESNATSFQDALQALSEAREAYERSLAAFKKMIGD